jgi:hypothetical protein
MADSHETQAAASSLFILDILDARVSLDFCAEGQGAEKLQLATGPHTARQFDGRQKTAAFGMAIGGESPVLAWLPKIQPMPQGG